MRFLLFILIVIPTIVYAGGFPSPSAQDNIRQYLKWRKQNMPNVNLYLMEDNGQAGQDSISTQAIISILPDAHTLLNEENDDDDY